MLRASGQAPSSTDPVSGYDLTRGIKPDSQLALLSVADEEEDFDRKGRWRLDELLAMLSLVDSDQGFCPPASGSKECRLSGSALDDVIPTEQNVLKAKDMLDRVMALAVLPSSVEDVSKLGPEFSRACPELLSPSSFRKIAGRPDEPAWMAAVDKEISAHERVGTWEWVDHPGRNVNVIRSLWVFSRKDLTDPPGYYKCKARVCAVGSGQRQGVDVFRTYAPVIPKKRCAFSCSPSR